MKIWFDDIKSNDPDYAEKHLWNALGFPMLIIIAIAIVIEALFFLYGLF